MTSSDPATGSRSDFSDLSRRLAAVGRELAEARDQLAVFRTLRRFIGECLPFNTFLVTLLDADAGLRRCAYCWSDGEEVDTQLFAPLPLNDTPASRALVADEPVLCDDFPAAVEAAGAKLYHLDTERDPRRTRSVLIVPMAAGGHAFGSIQLQSYETGLYVLSDAVPLAAVADQAATALEHVRLLARSREEWESTFDAMADPVVLVDANDRLRRANRAFWRFVDAGEVVLGRPLTEIMHSTDTEAAERCEVCSARRARREGVFSVLGDNIFAGRHLQVSLSRVEEPSTGFVGMIEVVRDVTELHAAEAAASSRQAILDSVLSSLADSVSLLDLEGRIVWVNPAGEEFLGASDEHFRGAAGIDLYDEADRPEILAKFRRACAGESVRFEAAATSASGRRMLLETSWAPVVESGEVTGVLGIARDVSEQRAAVARAAEGDKLRALGQLASGVAHDFNNLLASILGNAQLVARSIGGENASVDRKLAAIQRAARDGAETVRRIQNFTRVHAEASAEPLRVVDLFQQAVDLTRPRWKDQAQAQGAPVHVTVEPVDPRLLVVGNGAELREVLTNLIINAVDAMPTGGTITLGADVAPDSRARLVVRDTGEGMTDATQRRIFEPFFTTRGPQNSGLGLAVSYGIVRRHGGDIEVESREGEGTTFGVKLPLVEPTSRPRPAARPAEPAPRFTPLDRRVLVVDDDAAVRAVVADALAEAGATVTSVASGEEALAALERERYDVVVTDLGMPGVNGLDVARAVRERHEGVRVLLLTGWGEDALAEGGGSGAVDRVLAKPINLDDLVAAASEA